MKYLLIATLICLSISACTSQQKETESLVDDKAIELASDLKHELQKLGINISSKNEHISPEGYLIITVMKSDYFSDNAVITITPNRFDEPEEVAAKIKSMIDKSTANDSLPIMGVDIDIPGLFESNNKHNA